MGKYVQRLDCRGCPVSTRAPPSRVTVVVPSLPSHTCCRPRRAGPRPLRSCHRMPPASHRAPGRGAAATDAPLGPRPCSGLALGRSWPPAPLAVLTSARSVPSVFPVPGDISLVQVAVLSPGPFSCSFTGVQPAHSYTDIDRSGKSGRATYLLETPRASPETLLRPAAQCGVCVFA